MLFLLRKEVAAVVNKCSQHTRMGRRFVPGIKYINVQLKNIVHKTEIKFDLFSSFSEFF